MPLQTSGQISLSQIQTEYGGANNLSISEYYNGGLNSTPNVSTSRISKIRMKGISGTTDGNADIREFEFDGLGDWGTGDRRTGNNEITISTNMNTISDPNSNTEPPLNAWINGSKELDTPDSRFLVGQVTINSNYYIEFEFVGSATKPLVNDFNKLKIYWDKSDISQDADMGTWEIIVYNQDGKELTYGNITLTESNIVSTGGSSTDTSSITNLGSDVVLWHDAQNIDGTNNSSLTNGNTVTSWNNLSSSSFTTSNGTSYAPTYNGTGLFFNGAKAYNSTINLNNYSTMNIFVIWKPNSLHSNLRWLWGQDNGGYDRTLIMYASSGTTHYVGRGDGGTAYATYTFTANTTVIVNCEYNTSGQTGGFYINNSLNTSFSSLSPNGTTNTVFGAMNASAGQYSGASGITGDMYEIIIVNRLLTSTERTNIYNYLNQKWISGGGGSASSYHLEFNLGTPSAIASGGYVSGVSYIPAPGSAIKFSDFYYQAPSSGPPNPPNQTGNKGVSGGLGTTAYEIITGLYANNTSRTEGTTSFDNRGAAGRNSSNNVAYMNLIIQAKPGDVLNLIGRINTSGTYNEYCEFWVWLGSWSRFTAPNASFSGNRDFNVNYTIPSSTPAGNYALAVACSYSSLGSSSYRSWKSYSLEVWT